MRNRAEQIAELVGLPALLEGAAEECTELAKACLKLSRKLRGENPTPMTMVDLTANLNEELADVSLCMEVLRIANAFDTQKIEEIYAAKEKRWYERLAETNKEVK